jgi:archaellum component FlaC
MASANQVIDEINDFLDVITNTKLKKLSDNLDKLSKGITNPIEKKKT